MALLDAKVFACVSQSYLKNRISRWTLADGLKKSLFTAEMDRSYHSDTVKFQFHQSYSEQSMMSSDRNRRPTSVGPPLFY